MLRYICLTSLVFSGTVHAVAEEVQRIDASIPADDAFAAPEPLQLMEEGVVWLDLRMAPEFDPGIRQPDGTYLSLAEDCAFGPVEASVVSVNTGSNHLLMEVRMGTPEQHAGNILSCEYSPEYISEDGLGHSTRLKGCFFAHATSIPTAVSWVLNPLPASACGFGD